MSKTKNVRAKDVAARAIAENLSVEDVKKMIPEYTNPLPRRSWIITFLKTLPENVKEKFADLK